MIRPFYSWQILFVSIYIVACLDKSITNDTILPFLSILIIVFTILNFVIELKGVSITHKK